MKVSDIEFVDRQLNPRWNAKAEMAKKIRDFLDVPTHSVFRVLSPSERAVQHYRKQVAGLRIHTHAREVCYMIQAGFIP